MSEVPPLNIKVNIDASGVTAGVSKATAGLEQITAKTKGVSAGFVGLKTTILGVFGGTILTQGVMALGHELNAMKKEAIDLQTSTVRLNQALEGIGVTSKETQQAIFQNADAYYQLGFQGSEAVGAMGTLVTATGDVAQSNRLLAMAADLARYKHMDLNSAARILARGTQGAARAFKEMGITLDSSLPKNQAIAKAFDELNKKIGGQANAYMKTFAGQMALLKEKFDNVAQTIGAVVMPILTKFISVISSIFGWVSQNSAALKVFGGLVLTVTAYLKGLALIQAIIAGINPFTYVILGAVAAAAVFVKLWNTFEQFRIVTAGGLSAVIKLIGYLVGSTATLIKLLSKVPGMGFLKGAAKEADALAKSIGKAGVEAENLAKKKIKAPTVPKMPVGGVKPGESTGIYGNVPGGSTGGSSGGGGGGSGTVQYVTVYASNTNDIYKQLSKAAKNGTPIGAK